MNFSLIPFFLRFTTSQLFFIILIFNVLLAVAFNALIPNMGDETALTEGFYSKFLLVVVIAPIFETILFNALPILLIRKIIKNPYFLILLASIVFSLIHTYNIAYMFMTYLGGVGLNLFYYITYLKRGNNFFIACYYTSLLHAAYNLIGFVLIECFGF